MIRHIWRMAPGSSARLMVASFLGRLHSSRCLRLRRAHARARAVLTIVCACAKTQEQDDQVSVDRAAMPGCGTFTES